MNDLREQIKVRILTTKEVSEILKLTKQGVINRVNTNELIPIKKTSQGMLFDKEDIEKYLRNKQRIYSEIVTTYQLGYILTNNKNVLISGPNQSGKSYLINNIIHRLSSTIFSCGKKINVRDPFNDDLYELNDVINIYSEIDEKFFLHAPNISGTITSIQSSDEINAIKEFALEINKSVEYVLENIDYVIKIDTEINQNFIIKTENIKKLIDDPNLCIYRAISELPTDKPYFTYFYEQSEIN